MNPSEVLRRAKKIIKKTPSIPAMTALLLASDGDRKTALQAYPFWDAGFSDSLADYEVRKARLDYYWIGWDRAIALAETEE